MEPIYSGKVREIYDISEKRLVIVTTDRISAFDKILPVEVAGKGIVLNRLSNFWFHRTGDIIRNHIICERVEDMPEFFRRDYFRERTVMVEKLDMLPFEFVVRGYLFGSMWRAYEKGEAFCGITLPGGYEQAQKLACPVLTPALKNDTGHDEYVSMKEVESRLGAELTERITGICFRLYKECGEYAFSRGLILADAKFEFGYNDRGELTLGDEIFTPDSGRYWDARNYRAGISPGSYDKQFLRDWLLEHKADDGSYPENIPESVIARTQRLYQECQSRLTGESNVL